MVIRRIGPLSCATIGAALYAVVGLVIGGIVSLFSLAGGFATACRHVRARREMTEPVTEPRGSMGVGRQKTSAAGGAYMSHRRIRRTDLAPICDSALQCPIYDVSHQFDRRSTAPTNLKRDYSGTAQGALH
jgi:hypothetical protein